MYVGELFHQLFLYLHKVAACLAFVAAVGVGLVDKMHVFGTLQQAVEVVCLGSVAVLVGEHAESLSQVIWNQRVVRGALGDYPFVARHNDKVLEIDVLGLLQPHNLQSFKGFALERQCDAHGYALIDLPQGAYLVHKIVFLLQFGEMLENLVSRL